MLAWALAPCACPTEKSAVRQPPPALYSEVGQVEIRFGKIQVGLQLFQRGLRLPQRGARLADLLIELGGIDFGQKLAGLDAIAIIHQPRAEIAVHAREQG